MTGRTTGPRRVPGDVLVHLRRTRDHLDRHFAEPFDLDHLAQLAGMSRYHFIRSFAMTYGPTRRHGKPRRTASSSVTAGLSCAPLTPADA